MLNYARQRAIDALKIPHKVILATCGPAGVEVGEVACQAVGLDLYLRLPRTSDHLFNLEQHPAVALLAPQWKLKGLASIAQPDASPGPEEWDILIQVQPLQMQIFRERSRPQSGISETIDFQGLG